MSSQRRRADPKRSSLVFMYNTYPHVRFTASQTDHKSLINYYLREGLYQHAADEASEQIQRRGNDTYLLYWEGET